MMVGGPLICTNFHEGEGFTQMGADKGADSRGFWGAGFRRNGVFVGGFAGTASCATGACATGVVLTVDR